jgi:Winged helix DNA-binding domain
MRELTWDQVCARRLARTLLTVPAPAGGLVAAARAVCGVQAQVAVAAELALGARVAQATQQDVRTELWERRRLYKTYSLRGTLHLHPSDELPLWTAARQALPDWRAGQWAASYRLEPAQAEAVLAALSEVLDGQCLLREALADGVAARAGAWARERLGSIWADLIGLGFGAGLVCFGPSQGNKVTFVRTDQWLGAWTLPDPDQALAEVFRRYLTTFGPANPRDFASWFAGRWLQPEGLQGVLDALAGELVEVSVEGRRAWMLASDAAADWEPLVGTLRLVPQYDCYILGSRFGRERIAAAGRDRVAAFKNGRFEGATGLPLLLVDGMVAGMWERRQRGGGVEVQVEPFVQLTPQQTRQLEAEVERIGAFLGTKASLSICQLA